MTNPFSFTELELLLGCDARSEGNPHGDTCTLAAHDTKQKEKPLKQVQAQALHISGKQAANITAS